MNGGSAIGAEPNEHTDSVTVHVLRFTFHVSRLTHHTKLLTSPPDALFCYNNVMTSGALAALHRASLRVPAELAVTDFTEMWEAGWFVWEVKRKT